MACYYPPNALISDDGLNVVTLDDRYSEKYLIVGYDQSGFLKWSIDSVYKVISPSEFAKIQPNFFYVPWMGNYELTKQQLILRMKIPPLMNATKEKPDRAYYNWVASGEPETVRRIDLDSGNLLDEPVVTKKYDFPKFECANGLFKRQWLVWDHLEYSCSLSKYPVAPNLKVELEGEYKRYLYNYEASQWRLILRGQYKNNKRDGEWINFGLGSDNCLQRYKDGVVVSEEASGVAGKLFCDFD